jgi:hypothetical protein
MPDGNLYQEDFHAWALDQADKLRAAAKVQVPEHEGIDFEQVSNEVEDLGHSDRRKVESNLEVALKHIIKIAALPSADAVNHWKKEINNFLDSAVDGYSPSMEQYLDVDKLWVKARKRTIRDLTIDGDQVPELPNSNPFRLDQLLDEDFDVDNLVQVLTSAMSSDRPGLS